MEVRNGQQVRLAFVEPAGRGERLALRTVPVAAGVVRDTLVSAGVALLDVNSFDGLLSRLQARKFGAIDSAMNISSKRAEQVDFTEPLYLTPAQLVARKGSKLLPTPESLGGHSVGALQGSIQEQFAKQMWASKNVNVQSYQT